MLLEYFLAKKWRPPRASEAPIFFKVRRCNDIFGFHSTDTSSRNSRLGRIHEIKFFFFYRPCFKLEYKKNLFLFLFLRFLFQSPDRLWKPFKRRIVSTKDAVVFVVFFRFSAIDKTQFSVIERGPERVEMTK